jgi:hypothetical protein
VSARRAIGEAASATAPRLLATPSYLIFPSTVLILHPDYTSVITLAPLAVDRVRFEHTLLVPAARAGNALADHYAKSFDLIDGGVFQSEDLAACEAIQRGLAANPDDPVIAGGLEFALPWFHAAIDAAIAALTRPRTAP